MWYVSFSKSIAFAVCISCIAGCKLQLARQASLSAVTGGDGGGGTPSAPVVTIDTPVALSWANAATSSAFAVSGTCSEDGQSVTITGAGNAIATCSSGAWTANVDVSSASNGVITLYADHASAALVPATQASRQFQKDALAPGAPSFINPSTALTLGATTYAFSWSASDTGTSGLRAADTFLVERFANGTCSGAAASSGLQTATGYTYSPLSNGVSYSIRVTSYDEAGNTGASTCSAALTVNTSAPTLSIVHTATSSATHAVDNGLTASIGNDAGAVKWCLSETQTTAPASGAVACTGGYGPSSGWHTSRPGPVSIAITPEGTRTLYLWIADAADNVNPATVSDSIFADFFNPTWQGFTAPTAAVFQTATSYAFTWNAATDTAAGSGLHASEAYFVERFTNGTCAGAAASSGNQTGTSYNYTGLTAGTSYSIRVTAKDASGRTAPGFCSSPVTVTSSGFVWVGAGGDADWTTAANWAGGAVPGASDTAIFDGTCVSNCSPTLSTVVSVGGISMTSGYGGTITQAQDLLVGSGGFTQAGGTFAGSNSSGHELTIAGNFTLSGGTHTATNGITEIAGNVTLSGGTFNHNAGLVRIGNCASSAASTVNTGSIALGAVHLCKNGANITLASDLIVGGALSSDLGGGSIVPTTAQYIEARASVALDDAAAVGNLRLTGNSPATFTLCATCEANNVSLERTDPLTVTGTFRVRRNWTRVTGTVTATGSTIHFVGDLQSLFGDDTTVYGNVIMEKASPSDVQVNNTVTVGGNLTINNCAADCTVDTGTLRVRGNLTMTQGAGGTAAITLEGGSAQTVTHSGGTMPGGTFTVNKSANAATLASALVLNASGQDLVVQAGNFSLDTYNVTVNDRLDVSSGAAIHLAGNQTVSRGSFNPASGSWVFYSGSASYTGLTLGNSYASLRFAGRGLYTLNANLTVTDTLLLGSNSNLSAASYTISTPDWNKSATSTFTPGTSTVIMTGSLSTVRGSDTTFYNLTKSETSAAEIRFEVVATVTNQLTLQGATGQLLSVRSGATAGVVRNINATGLRTLGYLNVRDMNNIHGTPMYAGTTSTDAGNNTNWSFTDPPPSFDIEVPIEMLAVGRHSGTSAQTDLTTQTQLDTNRFDGLVSYHWEIVATNTDSVARNVLLVDGSSTTYATLSVPASTSDPQLFRTSSPWTPISGDALYSLRMPATTVNEQVKVYAARILVQQTSATRTKICYPLLAEDYDTTGYAPSDIVPDWTVSNTYDAALRSEYTLWKKDMARIRGLTAASPWSYEALLRNSGAVGYSALFNRTGSQVAGTEISVPSIGTVEYASTSFATDAANFDHGAHFMPDIRAGGGGDITLFKAQICARIDQLSRAEVMYQLGRRISNLSAIHGYQRAYIDLARFTLPTAFFETVGGANVGNTNQFQLRFDDAIASGHGPGTLVGGSTQTVDDTVARRRTGALSLAAGHYIADGDASSSGVMTLASVSVAMNQPVLEDIVLHLDAEKANSTVSAPHASGTGCASNLTWNDLADSNHGTLANFDGCGATGWQGSGTTPRSLFLDGVDDLVTVPDTNSLSFTSGGGVDQPFSIELWTVIGDMSSNRSLLTKNNDYSGSASEYVVWLDPSEQIHVQLTGGAWGADMLGVRTGTVSHGSFHQIVITYDGSKTAAGLKVYVDGVAQATTDISTGSYAGMINTASSLNLGAWSPGEHEMMGAFSIVRMYARELSASEVVQNCRADKDRFSSITCP